MNTISLFANKERGAVAIIVAICLAVLLGFVGIVLDLGKMFVAKTELQNAADACALAAARELTTTPVDINILTRAENAGITVGAKNKDNFQSSSVGLTQDNSVTFSDALNGSYNTKGSASANSKYARCTAQLTGIPTWFIQVLNVLPGISIGDQSVSSTAVATIAPSQSNCAVPMGLCGAPSAGSNFGFSVGTWYSTIFSPSNGNGGNSSGSGTSGSSSTGNFNWIDFNPGSSTAGCSGQGAQKLACVMRGSGQCSLPPIGPASCPNSQSNVPNGCVGQTGADSSLAQAYDSRFGLYNGSQPQASDFASAQPDYTGYSYDPTTWTAGSNAYSGTSGSAPNFLSARVAHSVYQGSLPGYSSASTQNLAQYGGDRRLVTAPIVDCAGYASSQTVPILGYACVLLLNPIKNANDTVLIEYLGRSNLSGSPCATSGAVGGAGSVGPLVPSLVQ